MKVLLIRHGMTEGNHSKKYIGVTDEPLCEEGIGELKAIRSQAAGTYSASIVFVSPMLRCRQTAQILFPNAKQIVVENLKEMDFGDFEGRTADEMADDPVYRKWVEDFCVGACPNGESQAGFRKRVCNAFQTAIRSVEDGAVFVVHGGVIMAIMAELAEPKRDFYDWYAQNLGGYTVDVAPNGTLINPQSIQY